jgi:two-component system OmpR family sensor kinase
MASFGSTTAVPLLHRAYDPVRLRYGGELLAVAALAVLAVAASIVLPAAVPVESTQLVLQLATAAGAAAAAVLADQCARLAVTPAERARLRALNAGLCSYALIVVPLTLAQLDTSSPFLQTARIVAFAGFLLLLGQAASRRPRPWAGRWQGLTLVALATAAASTVAFHFPVVGTPATLRWAVVAVLLGWLALAVLMLVQGFRADDALRWRLGLGLTIIAVAHLVRFGTDWRGPQAELGFPALRLLAVLVFLAALGAAVRAMLRDLRERRRHESEFASASVAALRRSEQRYAEREHEMRNLITGLAGLSHVLGSSPRAIAENTELVTALRTELDRLSGLLDGDRCGTQGAEDSADVAKLLNRLVLLRRAARESIELDSEQEVHACIAPPVLAQVTVNLLANCRRHAGGAPVHVRVRRVEDRVRIEVHDEGGGASPPRPRTVFPRGHRDPDGGGSGLGLHLSAELLRVYDGRLWLGPSPDFSGAVAVVDVPAVAR